MRRFSPLRSVWLQPTQTIARIAHENPGYRIFALPIIGGLGTWPTIAFFYFDEDYPDIGLFWLSLLTYGPIVEVAQVFVGAWLIQVTGSWLGGRAGQKSIQAAIAWGNVPIALIAVLCIPLAIASMILTEAVGTDLLFDPPTGIVLFGIALIVLQFVLVGWSFVILIRGLAGVQGYGLFQAAANVALAWLIPALLLAVLIATFGNADQLVPLFFDGFEKLAFFHAG